MKLSRNELIVIMALAIVGAITLLSLSVYGISMWHDASQKRLKSYYYKYAD